MGCNFTEATYKPPASHILGSSEPPSCDPQATPEPANGAFPREPGQKESSRLKTFLRITVLGLLA
jgi:hypothetical protein